VTFDEYQERHRRRVVALVAVALAFAAIFFGTAFIGEWIDCDRRGGIFVDQPFGWACVEAREVPP
jgi:hypothetical protein